MSAPTVSVIIVNYNTPDLVYACLHSLGRYLKTSHEVIVVDNGSAKKIDEELAQAAHGACTVLSLEKNRGFGGGNNAGAAQATGTYLWFLNSDTELTDSSPDRLFAFLKDHPEVGGISPLLYNDRELKAFQEDSYASFQSFRTVLLRQPRPSLVTSNEFFPVDVVVAAAVVVPRQLFNSLGGFDEAIFMFFEDDDLCYRIAKAGYQVGLHTASRILHLQGKSIATNRRRKEFYYASQTYFWEKHYGKARTTLLRLVRLPRKLLSR